MSEPVNLYRLNKGDRITITLPDSGNDREMHVIAVYDDPSLGQGDARTVLVNLRPDASGYGVTLRPSTVAKYNARTTLEQDAERKAANLGRAHGIGAASWYFDGNTTDATYRRVLDGIEAGDPEVLDTFPTDNMSGEWADSYGESELLVDLGISAPPGYGHPERSDSDDEYNALEDAVVGAYQDAFATAVHDEIERVARYHLEPEE
jgi:hypothetical protein